MIVINHNPDCGTSRNALAIIRATGAEPVVIEYLKTGWTRLQLLGLSPLRISPRVTPFAPRRRPLKTSA